MRRSTASKYNSKESNSEKEIELQSVKIDGESYFKISNSDAMRPFFMSIVSDSNHWLFISSNGGLTAGRKNSEYSLFPYYTDDKITESSEITGSKSIFWIDDKHLWEPFSIRQEGLYKTSRNLYKNRYGNKIIFEEINHDLEVCFRYQWSSSNRYGFVKSSTIENRSKAKKAISILDGLQNLLPYGVGSDLQNASSNLVDAYKRTELDEASGLGILALSAIIVDKAEPSEALKANVAWSLGLDKPKYLLSSLQLDDFRKKKAINQETDVKAEKGAYFVNSEILLAPNSSKTWSFVINVNQNHSAVAQLKKAIISDKDLLNKVEADVELGTQKLIELNASSDALQLTQDSQRDTRHFSNTLFNIMRGGIFDNNYVIEKWDFKDYLAKANKKVNRKKESLIEDLPDSFSLSHLHAIAEASDDQNFKRLCFEYMPLKFSRRHGDPSRPWNKFSINTRDEETGAKILDYEGNWRDIFQNWEALAYSYPEFIESMIHKFLNATTFDGYNPYRVTKDGFDWEESDPDDPWSYIGYWGDHQIIYLLKFLEFFNEVKPSKLEQLFNKSVFVYANVPYKIKAYQDILKNPKDTIVFDDELDAKIRQHREELGADGALLRDENRFIVKVNFIEKILATTLAKLSNFIPEGGIWMNTQRPEWNDANNALVGNGVSMVTLYYLRRFLKFFEGIFSECKTGNVEVSTELITFFEGIFNTLKTNEYILSGHIDDKSRKLVLDGLGQSASDFRNHIYHKSFSGRKAEISISKLQEFIALSLQYLEHSISANKRDDNMYHAYNLMTVTKDGGISISYLDEMLEGQVAVLSSKYLTSKEALAVLDSMKSSRLFRPDQYSYLLYPNKDLKGFMERNNVPQTRVKASDLLSKLVADGDTRIIEKDINGNYHFNGNFKNADDLEVALNKLENTEYQSLLQSDKSTVLELFETVFNHKAFTGRSGTFYGYEGLGSIYWHMVSKLLLAVQECCLKAINSGEDDVTVGKLLEHYYEINEGIGVHKSPELYGAFPTDPYSHTPAGKGAQQPGMTGQVKEDILSRFGELGVFVEAGQLVFNPCMLRKDEFLKEPKTFNYVGIGNLKKSVKINRGELAFTICQVPVVYKIADAQSLLIFKSDDTELEISGLKLDKTNSSSIFKRDENIQRIEVFINPSILK
ncbi:hypothetical protein DFQ05_1284 [Winogradskyella wandonensis]|uniref:Cellobiose phosphorylase n=1 Tax=Winogradskyella wandonensis TaxID=1442586 RepID=A0A4R1KR61_9FLAO|nr:hypothetical protein [Winogradskyella wandonensis]TCK67508.1 hypothetical protein DFQ05_1284 [Winogradskyella wandonensis]